MAELIRQGVDQMSQKQGHPDQKQLRQKAMQAAGKLSGPSDLSENHDHYLADIYQSWEYLSIHPHSWQSLIKMTNIIPRHLIAGKNY